MQEALSRLKRLSLLALAAGALSQAPPVPPQPLTFEVASVRPSPPLDFQKLMSGQLRLGMKVDKARVDISSMALADLICTAFRVKPHQVSGPAWQEIAPTGGQRFDVHATLPEGATEKDVPEMLQALLVERFGLKFRRDRSEQPIYALVVGKNGPKMKVSPPVEPPPAGHDGSSNNDRPREIKTDARGGATIRGGPGNVNISIQDGIVHMEWERMSMDRLADRLSQLMDRPVVNMTDLNGDFQVTLEFAQSEALNVARRMGAPPPDAMDGGGARAALVDASDPGGSSIFQTVRNLGLKLEARKSDIGRLIIDHLEKMPSEN